MRHCGPGYPQSPIRERKLHGKDAYVYFMANNNNNVLYLGVTNNLERRAWEHKSNIDKNSFTSKYNCHKLVYFEHSTSIKDAIAREKQLKNWKREWKNELIEKQNPKWEDLSKDWYPKFPGLFDIYNEESHQTGFMSDPLDRSTSL